MIALVFLLKVLGLLCNLYTYVLIARLIFDWLQFIGLQISPESVFYLPIRIVYALTDPILSWLRKHIPALKMGLVALDMGYVVLFFATQLLARLVQILLSSIMLSS